MSKNNDNKLVPKLRFPEFKDKEDWELLQIGSILNAESSTLALNKLDFKQNGYAVYGADGIIGYIDNFQQKGRYITIVKDGSGVGRLSLCEGETSTIGTLSTLKSKDEKNYNLVWAFYLLNTINFSSYVKGSGIPHIYFSDYKNENIGVPKPEEQQKIASCLSSLDEVITAEGQKLELLKEHKKGLLQNLFPQEGETVPKFRFKEFVDGGEWDEKELGSFCINISSGKDKNVIDGEYELYGSTGIIGRTENASHEGDFILVARVGANAGLLNKVKGKFGVTDNTLVIDLVKKDLINFIFYSLESVGLNKLVFGSGQPLITGGQLKNFSISTPSSEQEQKKISNTLSSIDDLIKAQSQKIEALKLHKKGLLQGLFPDINEENQPNSMELESGRNWPI